jgi:hypothetical protein
VQLSLQYHGQEVSTQSECPFCLFDDNCYHSLEGYQPIKTQDHVDSHLMCFMVLWLLSWPLFGSCAHDEPESRDQFELSATAKKPGVGCVF